MSHRCNQEEHHIDWGSDERPYGGEKDEPNTIALAQIGEVVARIEARDQKGGIG